MTFTIKQSKGNGYYACIEQEKTGAYKVSVLPMYKDGLCGYPIHERFYGSDERKLALVTYNRYRKNYTE